MGHANNARWTEEPHLYKINGTYLLLVAERGAAFHHSVNVHNSDELWGPNLANLSNPWHYHGTF